MHPDQLFRRFLRILTAVMAVWVLAASSPCQVQANQALTVAQLTRIQESTQGQFDGGGPSAWYIERAETSNSIANLLRQKRFAELDALAAELLQTRARLSSGWWKLRDFYFYILPYNSALSKVGRSGYLDLIERWVAARPQSTTAKIVLAAAYNYFAWRERGGGYAGEVTEKGWQEFHRLEQKAMEVLTSIRHLPPKDPEFYALLGLVGAYNKMTQEELSEVFEQGVALEPEYDGLFTDYAGFLRPQWGGAPGAIARFAAKYADRTREQRGDALYARLAIAGFRWGGKEKLFNEYRFEWPRVRRGMEDLLEQYPGSQRNLHYLIFFACLARDRYAASELLQRRGSGWTEDAENIWRDKKSGFNPRQNYDNSRKWALYPEREQRQSEFGDALLAAIESGDREAAIRLASRSADTGNPRPGETLLLAANRRMPKVVRALIGAGADVNHSPNRDGVTALFSAVSCRCPPGLTHCLSILRDIGTQRRDLGPFQSDPAQLEVVETLIAAGADVNTRDLNWKTPLMWAALLSSEPVVEMLLDAGADTKALDRRDHRARDYAAGGGNRNTTGRVLAAADGVTRHRLDPPVSVFQRGYPGPARLPPSHPRAAAQEEQRARLGALDAPLKVLSKQFHNAIARGDQELAGSMIAGGMSPDTQRGAFTVLQIAILYGRPGTFQLLLDAGADVVLASREGITPLHTAAEYGRTDMARTLLAAGAPVDARDDLGRTPLLLMMTSGDPWPDIVQILLEAGADPNAVSSQGQTPVTQAPPDTLRVLLGFAADVNAVLPDGRTLLMRAANFELQQQLVELDADVHLRDSNHATALMYAAARASAESVQLLIAAGSDIAAVDKEGMTALFHAVRAAQPATVAALIAAGSDPGHRDIKQLTPLLHAASAGFEKLPKPRAQVVSLFLEPGVEGGLEARDAGGRSALSWAAGEGQPGIVGELLRAGAEVDTHDDEGRTPLYHALLGQARMPARAYYVDAAKLLVAAGADLHRADRSGITAIGVAEKKWHRDCFPPFLMN